MSDKPESVEEFLKRGGKIKEIGCDVQAAVLDPSLKNCRCGCYGDYTEHSMRKGERGIYR